MRLGRVRQPLQPSERHIEEGAKGLRFGLGQQSGDARGASSGAIDHRIDAPELLGHIRHQRLGCMAFRHVG
jgi:hypothetical protein